MGVKEFLKPSKGKVLSASLLLGMTVILIWFIDFLFSSFYYPIVENIILSIISFPFLLVIFLFCLFYHSFFLMFKFKVFTFSIILSAILISVIVLILTYVFGCYINRSKKVVKGLALFLVAFLTVFVAIFILIEEVYNPLFGYSCDIDNDCFYNWDIGSVNYKYIALSNPYRNTPSISSMEAICESNRCVTLDEETTSWEYCGRREGSSKSACYWHLAKNLNDPNLCDKMEEEWKKERCIEQFEK